MSDVIYFIDTNVIMYGAGRPHKYREPCVTILKSIADGSIKAAIDAEVIQEILYRFGALRQWELACAMSENALRLVDTVFPIRQEDVQLATTMYLRYGPQGVTARDVIHAAVLENNRLSTIISADVHFDLFDNITRTDPIDFTG
jgi:predicted nucleic acid-binding protein